MSEAETPREEFTHRCTVRYGSYRFRGLFGTNDQTLACGETVVVRSPRDVEIGTIVSRVVPRATEDPVAGPILRRATQRDKEHAQECEDLAVTRLGTFVETKAAELGLPLKLINVERLLGEQKVVIHYTSEGRIDFRELVHVLARRFHARIEMRQIGPRDCTRITGGIGTCGLALCCATWISRIEPVTIRMAKEQGQPLNPGKNCGCCGKLKCCLRYELEPGVLDSFKRPKRSGNR